MPDLAYLNGEIMPIEKATVPIEDRGYQFGDGIYEFVASYAGRLFMLEEHLDRLDRSTGELAFDAIAREKIKNAIMDLFERSGYPRAGIYIQISRGVAPRNHAFSSKMSPQIVMTIRAVKEVPKSLRENGARAITVNIVGDAKLDDLYGSFHHNVISDVRELPDKLLRLYSALTR